MKFTKHTLSLGLVFVLASSSAFAQDSLFLTDVVATPQFFVSLLAGVLLAIGFQVLLTALSVAIGISAVGNVQHHANHPDHDSDKDNKKSSGSDTPLGVKISSGLGLFTLITSSIALFFAAMLAVKLSLIGNAAIGITLGLVIWAAFFTALAYLEITSVSTLIGSLINTVVSGIKSSASAVGSAFQGSPYSKIENIADHTIEKVRNELQNSVDLNQINQKIDEYAQRMEESTPNYDQVKQDMVDLLKDIRIEEKTQNKVGGEIDTELFVKFASEQPNVSKKDAKKMGKAFKDAQKAFQEGDSNEDKAKKVAAQLSGKSEEDISGYVEQIEDYLRSTDKEEVSPDAIREDIERIIENPKSAQEILSNRAGKIDRSTWVALLEKDQRMNHDRAEKVVSYVEQAIDFVAKKKDETQQSAQGAQTSVAERAGQMQGSADGKSKQLSPQAEGKLKAYFDGLNRPELQYESLKWDVEKIMNDPKVAPQVLKSRLSQFDRETMMALLTSNDRLSRRDIENLSTKIDESKSNVMKKVEEIDRETSIALERAKQEALHQAENTRKTAASAAWWLFATAVVSGVAAALGGWVAII
ncbi:MAG: hypothetical protein WA958_18210 [Tunicatimonas sp.]